MRTLESQRSIVESNLHGPRIYLHAVLNCNDVPRYVFQFILTHELLHLIVPPKLVQGKLKNHSPEFFERERQLAPERDDAWRWIVKNLGKRLRVRPREECLEIQPDQDGKSVAPNLPQHPPTVPSRLRRDPARRPIRDARLDFGTR